MANKFSSLQNLRGWAIISLGFHRVIQEENPNTTTGMKTDHIYGPYLWTPQGSRSDPNPTQNQNWAAAVYTTVTD